MNSWLKPYNLWCITRNGGKALALDTKIPTPDGFKTIGDLQIGEYVLDEQGKQTRIEFISDIFYDHDCYEVLFEDGEKIIADAEHLWNVKVKDQGKDYKILHTKDMINNYVYIRKDGKGKEYKYRVPMNKPIEYKEKILPIHPYILGVWIGDGNSRDTRITCSLDDTYNMDENIRKCGYNTKILEYSNNVNTINIGFVGKGNKNEFKTNLINLNLIKNKYIPNNYLFASIEQRYELLRGLMDTDGSCYGDNNSKCEFVQKDYNITMQFSQLLSSLGIKHSIGEKNVLCNNKMCHSYRILFYVDKNNSCFKLKRKHDRLRDNLNKRMLNKSIISIKKVNSVPTKCIGVDNPMHLYLCGERFTVTHNSTLSAPFIMAKGILIGGHNTYILSNVSSQSQDTFMKIEKIAKKEIASFAGLTDFFMGELVKSTANTDGFTHSQSGFNYKLFNGSTVTSLSGSIINNRGKRSALNLYDESGWTDEDYVVATTPFLLQNSTFKLGAGIDITTYPQQIPNQRLFISSASSTDSYFYTLYKDYAKRMFLGDKDYFVCDLNCEIMLNATYNGKLFEAPLINKTEIDAEMRKNKEKALREFYNKFSVDGGDNQPFKRAMIVKNCEVRLPVLSNDDKGKRKFLIAYDPAHQYDNSVCMIAELINDDKVGERLEICGGVSFVDIAKKKKTPMRTPEQIALLKKMILDYNGKGNPDYENIECLLIDAGSGGHGTTIADYLMEDWIDSEGRKHKGFIDKEECKEHVSKFPNAVDKLKLLSPQKYKKDMFDALLEMINLDLVSFTNEYDSKGYLMLPKLTGKKIDIEDENGNIIQDDEVDYKKVKLDFEEELVLKNIDIAKEELIYTYRYKGTGENYRYDLSKEKVGELNDDRSYCLAMLGWYLQEIRRKHITGKKKNTNISPSSYFAIANKSSRARR